jgi:hypothetical protein
MLYIYIPNKYSYILLIRKVIMGSVNLFFIHYRPLLPCTPTFLYIIMWWQQTVLGLVRGFSEQLQNGNTNNWQSYWLIHFKIQSSYSTCTVLSLHYPLLRSGFQWQTFLFLWVPELSLVSATSLQPLTTVNLKPCLGPFRKYIFRFHLFCFCLEKVSTEPFHKKAGGT